jgi:hypothetical protein
MKFRIVLFSSIRLAVKTRIVRMHYQPVRHDQSISIVHQAADYGTRTQSGTRQYFLTRGIHCCPSYFSNQPCYSYYE